MAIQKFSICRDAKFYLAWPDVALTRSGKLVCVFSECTHHGNRDYTRVMLCDSFDRGRTWTPKRPLTESAEGTGFYYNCARISVLPDGRLAIMIDKVPNNHKSSDPDAVNYLYLSHDEGKTWEAPILTPLRGIVPDRLTVVANNRWIIAAHYGVAGKLAEFLHYSDDEGKTWSPAVTVASDKRYNLCEGSLLDLGKGELVMFLRENSGQGWDCLKVISHDNGETWGPVINFPLPGCHRPSAGVLQDGRILITYRMMQGGKGSHGFWLQNFFAALSNRESALAVSRQDAATRIMPVDFDRSPYSDTGYSGWVQFPDGEIYVVNYIVDDNVDKGQIRGYSMTLKDFLINE